ncbi:unknown protein [Seminavis robusta]|uniref:Uncharacterized protein n=1 Tax=Seminavis robusta TaxID=568900 RepID=A0A9N8E7G1_9STRA|nr:unknown protein [Seminavis robusta]|eukprot:Sro732_g194490.1 n/a (285) ;mRNA; r:47930-48843
MSSVRESLFLSRINQALDRACRYYKLDPDNLWSSWCKEAKKGFLKGSNTVGLPTPAILRYGGDVNNVMVDSRCLIDHINNVISIGHVNNSQLLQNKNKLNDIHHALTVQTPRTMDFLIKKVSYIESTVRRLEDAFVGSPHAPTKPPPVSALPGSLSPDFPVGYKRDKDHADWQNEEFQNPLKKLFCKVKRAVRLVLLFSDSYPQPNLPKAAIRGLAEAAEKELRVALGAKENDTLSMHTIETKKLKNQVKTLEESRKLPLDIREDVQNWWWNKKALQNINPVSW